MSFDYNPYKHIEVLHEPHGNYRLYCHSCGGEFGDYTGKVSAKLLFEDMAGHILSSHQRPPIFFETWSIT